MSNFQLPISTQLLSTQAWSEYLDALRFMPADTSIPLWFWLLHDLNLQARPVSPSKRSRRLCQRRQALWHFVLHWQPVPTERLQFPLEAALLFLADDLAIWQEPEPWRIWLPFLYSCCELIQGLIHFAQQKRRWKKSTRKLLLTLGIQWLAPILDAETQLNLLAELTELACTLGLDTQQELLQEERALLLSTTPPKQQASLAFSVGFRALRQGEIALAQQALQYWQNTWSSLSQDEQVMELGRICSEWRLADAEIRSWPLERYRIIHRWWLSLVRRIQPLSESPHYMTEWKQLIRIGLSWQLPEAVTWLVGLPVSVESPLQNLLCLAYEEVLSDQEEALRTWQRLPAWLKRWNFNKLAPFYHVSWYLPKLNEPEARIWFLHLQTATLLLKASSGSARWRRRRRQLLNWGRELLQPLQVNALTQLKAQLFSQLQDQRLSWHSSGMDAIHTLRWNLAKSQELVQAWAWREEVLNQPANQFSDWFQAVLSLNPEELEPVDLQSLETWLQAFPLGWTRWQLELVLAQGLLQHQPWQRVASHWFNLLETWEILEGYQPLHAIASMGLALISINIPNRAEWFKRLHQLALRIDPIWRDEAICAVGLCQIRGGDFSDGFQTFTQLSSPQRHLQALLQVNSILEETNQCTRRTELGLELLACSERQTEPGQIWLGYLTGGLLQWIQGESHTAHQHMRKGLEALLKTYEN